MQRKKPSESLDELDSLPQFVPSPTVIFDSEPPLTVFENDSPPARAYYGNTTTTRSSASSLALGDNDATASRPRHKAAWLRRRPLFSPGRAARAQEARRRR